MTQLCMLSTKSETHFKYNDGYVHTMQCAKLLSDVRLFVTPWTGALQAPLSMGFSRREYWSVLPCHPPGNIPDPGIKPKFPACPALQANSLPLVPPGNPTSKTGTCLNSVLPF